MKLINHNKIDDYIIPVFIFLIIITSYWDSPIRKIISILLPLLFITKYFLTSNARVNIRSPLTFFVLSYIIWCFISAIFSVNPINSFFYATRILIFFVLIDVINKWMVSKRKLILTLTAIFYSGLVSLFFIILNSFSGKFARGLSGEIRIGGLFSNINSAGFIFTMSIIFTYILYDITKNKKLIGGIILLGAGLILTGSRASMLLLVVTFSFVFISRRKISTSKIILLSLTFIVFSLSIALYWNKINTFLRLDHGDSGRSILYQIGKNIMSDKPIFGVGLGNIKVVALRYVDNFNLSSWAKEELINHSIQSSHNMYYETGAELGYIGLILLILIQIAVLHRLTIFPIKNNANILFLGLLAGVIIRGLFESNGFICKGWISIDIFFWLALIIYKRINLEVIIQKKLEDNS